MRAANEVSPTGASAPVPAAAERAALAFLTPRRAKRERTPPEGSVPLEFRTRVGQLRGWKVGTGPQILFVHGWEGDSIQFTPWVAPLLERGFSAVGVDLPAHGASEGQTASAVKFAEALLEIAPSLGLLSGLVAHSVGGAGAGLALAEGLPVARLCLLAPVAEPMPFARAVARALQLEGEAFPAYIRRVEQLVGRSFDSLDVPRLLARTPAEVLVVHDPQDAEVPFSHGERYARGLPSARLVPLEGAGHRPILRDPRVIAEGVRFLTAAEPEARHG